MLRASRFQRGHFSCQHCYLVVEVLTRRYRYAQFDRDSRVMQFGAGYRRRSKATRTETRPHAHNEATRPQVHARLVSCSVRAPLSRAAFRQHCRLFRATSRVTFLRLEQCSGFMKLKWNDKVNGCFAKFSSAATAEQALRDPQGACFGAEWARRNLD